MSSFWRQAGLSYVRYSAICAQVVRNCLQPTARTAADKNAVTYIKYTKWEGGKPIKSTSGKE